jgi:hypothetical protein
MTDIYMIEYSNNDSHYLVAMLEDRNLVKSFMTNVTWRIGKNGDWCQDFKATHYKKDPSGVLQFIGVLDYSQWRPQKPPPLARIRIPRD